MVWSNGNAVARDPKASGSAGLFQEDQKVDGIVPTVPPVELDLRGDICPITFVKSKLALEEMETGALLRVIVDYLPSVKNVPASMENEGHLVLSVRELQEGLWEILVKKA